jgi:hypothetical protein
MKRHNECEQIREELLLNPSAELPPALAEHVRGCTECGSAVESLRKTWRLLDAWQVPEPSPYFDSKLQARLREEKANPQPEGLWAWLRARWQPALAGALAVALAIAIGTLRLRTGPAQIGPPPVTQSAAVSDLDKLDKNADVYNNFDLLYGDDDQQTSDQ